MATVRNAAHSQKRRQDRRTPNGRAEAQPLQRDLPLDAGAGAGAEAVAAADLAVGQCATSLRGLRRGAAGAAAYYGDGRGAEGDGARWQRADVLRERAPVQGLV